MDGLVALAESYVRDDTVDRVAVEFLVTVSLATLTGASDQLAQFADGSHDSAESARRLACDAEGRVVGEL